ncbi:MAG: hypothetical protein A2035_07920 [Nitrospirae bacterium GWA2_42_11]|nr:MAG: hypothetical protein A2035_07920 [Nitrospirae bacterium GWA2_42_11]HAS17814.1 hypothetical protein [Nitrospiraceae bacterium]
MKVIIFIFSLIVSFSIPAHAVEFEIIKTHDVTIKYEKGLSGVSNEIGSLIPSLKEETEKRIGLPINFSFDIIIYRDRKTFRRLVNSDMIAAFAIPGQDLIVLDYSQFRHDPLTLKLIVMHEMCHLLLHKNIAWNNLPRWFDEGLSQWVSSGINEIVYPRSTDVLKMAFISGTLLPFSTISEALPPDTADLILSYEQGRSMVDYIEQRYGMDSIKGIISRLSSGAGFHDAVNDELGADFTEIEKKWRRDKGKQQYTWFAYISDHIYLILFFISAFLTIYGFIRLRKRMRDYQDEEIL